MSKSIKVLGAVSLMVLVAACSNNQDDFVVVDPEPISVEPAQTGKY